VAEKGRIQLKDLFRNGAIPSDADFSDLIDSFWNFQDDGSAMQGPTGPTGPAGSFSGYTQISFEHTSFNPSASTNYYIGDLGKATTSSSVTAQSVSLFNGIATRVYHHHYTLSPGSTEASAMYLKNVTTGISEQFTSSVTFDVTSQTSLFTLSSPLVVSYGDVLEIIWQTAAWSSPPTGVTAKFQVLVEY
jgi:hypothetical protein